MSEAAETKVKELRQELNERMKHVRHKVLVLSGKGGVGKSTVSVNLAAALAAAGQHVGLLDVDIHGPSIPKLLGLEGRGLSGAASGLDPVRVSPNLVVCSVGFLLEDEDAAVIWRGPRKFALIRQFLAEINWGNLDFLVIDSPPGTGDEPLAVCELTEEKLPRPAGGRPNRGAIVVTTPQSVALADVKRSIRFCREVGMPIHGLVENMSQLICPRCGLKIDVFGSGGGERLAHDTGVPFLGRIPLDPAIGDAGEAGVPIVRENRELESEGAKAAREVFDGIAAKLIDYAA